MLQMLKSLGKYHDLVVAEGVEARLTGDC